MNRGRIIIGFFILALILLSFIHILTLSSLPRKQEPLVYETVIAGYITYNGTDRTFYRIYTDPIGYDQVTYENIVKLLLLSLICLALIIALFIRRKREIKEF